MKKLEKLVLQDVVPIPEKEQRSLYGGGSWVTGPDGNLYYYVGDIEIGAFIDLICPRCEQNKEWGIVNDLVNGSENQRFWLNTMREFLCNTLPHILGSGGHIPDDYTIYRYRVYGSDWTLWASGI